MISKSQWGILIFTLLVSVPVWFSWGVGLPAALFTLGVLLGISLLLVDQFWLVRWYTPPEEKFAEPHLLTRSLVFLACYLFVALFVVTSTGSQMGIGMVLGLGIFLSGELALVWKSLTQFQQKFGWQIAHLFTETEQHYLTSGFWLVVVVLAGLASR